MNCQRNARGGRLRRRWRTTPSIAGGVEVQLAVTVPGRRIAGRERAALNARRSPGLVHLAIGALVRNVTVLVLPVVFLVRLSGDRAFLGSLASSRPRARLRVVGGRLLLGRFGLIG